MDLADYIPKVFRALARSAEEETPTNTLGQFGKGRVKLRRYYAHWHNQIRAASASQRILSNGWAFSTLSGVAAFESYVGGEPSMHSLYVNRVGEIEQLAELVAQCKGPRPFGAMVYGYGNLIREAQWLEHLVKAKVLTKRQRVYLLDCSLFYHLFAKSDLNPLRDIFSPKRLRPILIDCFNGEVGQDDMKYARDDLNAARPTIHMFLGNTFGNVTAETVRGLLATTVRPSDFVIAEYANYSQDVLTRIEPDYVSEMAKRAAAEMFSNSEAQVIVTNAAMEGQRHTDIEIVDLENNAAKLKFKSMLRRAFKRSEVTDGNYELIGTKVLAAGTVSVDVFRCSGT